MNNILMLEITILQSCIPGLKHIADIEGDWLMLLCLIVVILFVSLKVNYKFIGSPD